MNSFLSLLAIEWSNLLISLIKHKNMAFFVDNRMLKDCFISRGTCYLKIPADVLDGMFDLYHVGRFWCQKVLS